MKFNTKVIHANLSYDSATGAIMTPIYQTSTYVQEGVGNHKGFEYSRTKNPTRLALENNLASLENGKFGLCFGSGMAAIDCVLKLLSPNDQVIVTNDLYGGTFRIFTEVFQKLGIVFHFVDMTDLKAIKEKINAKTKLIWVETPTNPLLKIIDIKAVKGIIKSKNILLAVDNTFASPFLQQPLDLGADIVMHSATKYLGGHSDVILGALVCKDEKLAEQLFFLQNTCGNVCGPMDSFLTLRGIKTLHLRMQRHCENAKQIVKFLSRHPKIEKIYWPGLPEHPNHNVAKKQMRDFGGMVSFTLKGNFLEKTLNFLNNLKIFALAESLGGVESLIGHPATMTHASVDKNIREKVGIIDSLIRLSVGVEDTEDLIKDLDQALENA